MLVTAELMFFLEYHWEVSAHQKISFPGKRSNPLFQS